MAKQKPEPIEGEALAGFVDEAETQVVEPEQAEQAAQVVELEQAKPVPADPEDAFSHRPFTNTAIVLEQQEPPFPLDAIRYCAKHGLAWRGVPDDAIGSVARRRNAGYEILQGPDGMPIRGTRDRAIIMMVIPEHIKIARRKHAEALAMRMIGGSTKAAVADVQNLSRKLKVKSEVHETFEQFENYNG